MRLSKREEYELCMKNILKQNGFSEEDAKLFVEYVKVLVNYETGIRIIRHPLNRGEK